VADDIDAFHVHHLAERAARFITVDRSGHPRDLLIAPQAAEVLSYCNDRSLPDELLHNPNQAARLPSGRLRRYLYRRTVWNYADGRRCVTPRAARRHRQRPSAAASLRRRPSLDAAFTLVDQGPAAGHGTAGLATHLARQLGPVAGVSRTAVGCTASPRGGRCGAPPRHGAIRGQFEPASRTSARRLPRAGRSGRLCPPPPPPAASPSTPCTVRPPRRRRPDRRHRHACPCPRNRPARPAPPTQAALVSRQPGRPSRLQATGRDLKAVPCIDRYRSV